MKREPIKVYKRLETDQEMVARLNRQGASWDYSIGKREGFEGKKLDDALARWGQRRIVDDEA